MKQGHVRIIAAALACLFAAAAPVFAKSAKKKAKTDKEAAKRHGAKKGAVDADARENKNANKEKDGPAAAAESSAKVRSGTPQEPAPEKSDAKKDPMKDMGSR